MAEKKDGERRRSQSPHKGKFIVNEVDNASKPKDSDSTSEDENRKSKGRPIAMAISDCYPAEGGEREEGQ